MPKRSLPATFADAYAAVSTDLRQRIGDAQAAQAGPPASLEIQPANDADRVRAWETPHPEATDQAMQALAQQRYAAHTQAGMDAEKATLATAEDLTHYRYRGRLSLYSLGTTSWDEQVKEAKRLSRLAEKGTGDETAPSTDTQPSPLSPSAQPGQGGY